MNFFVSTLIPFFTALALQLAAIALLPRTKGFTAPLQTVTCLAVFALSLWTIARIAQRGVSLGILIPLLNAAVPMGAVLIGGVLYGESVPLLKIAMLVVACTLIGLAARVN